MQFASCYIRTVLFTLHVDTLFIDTRTITTIYSGEVNYFKQGNMYTLLSLPFHHVH